MTSIELSGGVVDLAQDVYDVGRGLGGPQISGRVALASVADFFRKGSDANFAAFQSNVVKELGNQAGLSEGDAMARFADLDIDVALSLNQRNVLDSLKSYIGEGEPNAEYAQLGYAISNYTRHALLVEKYYANGRLDENFQLANTQRELGLDDKFSALSSYWGGFLSARLLAYIGGFPTTGLA